MPLKESALGRLNGLKELKGPCESEFLSQVTTNGSKIYYKGIPLTHANEKSQTEKLKVNYIDSVSDRMDSRIAAEEMLEAFSVLEPQAYDSLTAEESTSHLKKLADKYDSDFETLRIEHSGIKYLMKGSYKNLKFKAFCKKVLNTHTEDFPEISRLCRIALCIPVSSVACERGFSLQNKIKVKSRTSLNPESLDRLMRLAVGPCVKEFPYARAIHHWNGVKRRRLARLYQPSKPKDSESDSVVIE